MTVNASGPSNLVWSRSATEKVLAANTGVDLHLITPIHQSVGEVPVFAAGLDADNLMAVMDVMMPITSNGGGIYGGASSSAPAHLSEPLALAPRLSYAEDNPFMPKAPAEATKGATPPSAEGSFELDLSMLGGLEGPSNPDKVTTTHRTSSVASSSETVDDFLNLATLDLAGGRHSTASATMGGMDLTALYSSSGATSTATSSRRDADSSLDMSASAMAMLDQLPDWSYMLATMLV
jgi:hypothetical protein